MKLGLDMGAQEAELSPVVVMGGGGHAKVVIEALRAAGWAVMGILDPGSANSHVFGVPVLGGDEVLERLRHEGIAAAVVALGSNSLRARVGADLRARGFDLPAIIHPAALVSPSAKIGAGAVIMARAIVGVETEVDELAIVNTGAILDHDNRLGRAGHVAPGCALAGSVRVGARSLVGVGSAVRPNITIGDDVIIGAGSAVVSDIPDGAIVGGAPAKELRWHETRDEL